MRTTIDLDDDLIVRAQALTGIRQRAALMRAALQALIERESARTLVQFGGSEPDLGGAPRRRLPTTDM